MSHKNFVGIPCVVRSHYAWYNENSGDNGTSINRKTHEVKTKNVNAYGLYDMSGNVWEWCWDWYGNYSSGSQTNPSGSSSGSYRVERGGSWYSYPSNGRVAFRYYDSPSRKYNNLGFRVVRSASK